MKKRYAIPALLTPRERRILGVVRRIVSDAASNYGALPPGDRRNEFDPAARTAEKLRDEVLRYLDANRTARRRQ